MSDPVVERYAVISKKLKKRFLRKPNVAEARDNFHSLGKQLASQGNIEYAASCFLSAAQCEEQLGNVVGETNSYTMAADLFLQIEKSKESLSVPSEEQYLVTGIDCYNRAINKLQIANKVDIAAKLCVELGCVLVEMGHVPEAEPHFTKAAQLINPGNVSFQIIILQKLAYCKNYCRNYTGAVEVLDRLSTLLLSCSPRPAHIEDTLQYCETTSLLLVLLIATPSAHLKPDHRRLLEKFSTVPYNIQEQDTERFMSLVDITLAVQMQDYKALAASHSAIYNKLSGEQNELIKDLIQAVSSVRLIL